MRLINNIKEFKDIWYYKSEQPRDEDYPTEYPCVVEVIHYPSEMVEDRVHHEITYIPEGLDPTAFLMGYRSGRKVNDKDW